MRIPVREIPNCTWELEGDAFFCTHDEVEVETYTTDYMTFDGPDQYETEGYVCADPDCGEPLEGNPVEDRIDEDAEYERSRDY